MSLQHLLDDMVWRDVPNEACRLAKAASGTYLVLQDLIPSLPDINAHVWYAPDIEKVAFSYPLETDSDKVASWHIAMKQVPGVEEVEHGFFFLPQPNVPFIRVKEALENKTIFGPVASALQLKPNMMNKLWGGPNPLASTIAGGLLGAGLGYGGGWLAEQLLPEDKFERGKLRRTSAIMGGLAGAVPGAWWGLDNMRAHPDPSKQWSWKSWLSQYPWTPQQVNKTANRYESIKESMLKSLPEESHELNEYWVKYANEAGAAFLPMIPVDQFNRTIWNDLRSAGGYTPPPLAAATTGLVQAAALSQGGTNYVSPVDIARIGLGMGTGYMSGMIVGKTLGALAGLRPEAQQSLQQAGAWAGILTNVVPLVFR